MLRRGFNGFHFDSVFICLKKSLTLLYSTSVASKDGNASPLMAKFLVKSVGFSEQEAISIALKIKVSLSLKNSELVVDFLKQSGLDGAQIRKVIAERPHVLRNKVEKTLMPKIRALEDLGFSGSNLRLLISRHPRVLCWSLECEIVPTFRMLKSVIGSNEQLVRSILLMNSRLILSSQAGKNISANIQLMQSYGLTSERIKWLMLSSSVFQMRPGSVERILKQVEEKLGIPRTSNMFKYGIRALTMRREENIEPWLESFRSYGWSEADISTLLRKSPMLFGLSKENVRAKLKYFMEGLGLGSDYLATYPALLSCSLEKRLVPRVAVRQILMERRLLKPSVFLFHFLAMGESKFLLKYVLPYKEELPQLYEDYTKATGRSLSKT